VAVDAATRGYAVLLLEQSDFGKGTSSRSTKLIHGGVRYLAQGSVGLVREALRERGRLLRNAPHLVHDRAFVVPAYAWWEKPYYGLGLTAYDLLAGSASLGRSRTLSRSDTLRLLPSLQPAGLRGGVLYHDGQFDDARLLVHLLLTAAESGAVVLNYAPVTELTTGPGGRVTGVVAHDAATGQEFRAAARVVVNATGAFCDGVRRLADPAAPPLIAPSQGTHLVFDRSVLPGDSALLVPRTPDGRVLFAIPWHGHTLVGTTDMAVPAAPLEPRPTDEEIDFILETCGGYFAKPPTRADVRSTFAGVRPLVRAKGTRRTASLSREHVLQSDRPGLLTIAGGKWTTYRAMAEHCVDRAAALAGLPRRPCATPHLPLHGSPQDTPERYGPLHVYGADASAVQALQRGDPALAAPLHPDLPYTGAEVVWAARRELGRTVEDVLARRTRALFLNAAVAVAVAPRVAELLAAELGRAAAWQSAQVAAFAELARGYRLGGDQR
jgi:glycerol-3-phosphate dehydrogenase